MILPKTTIREQLEKKLNPLRVHLSIARPPGGWVRAIRDALGMSGRQLAARLGLSKQRIAQIERDEQIGAVTLHTMQETAAALDCIFVYALLPRASFETTLTKQAERIVLSQSHRVQQTMQLENQNLNDEQKQEAIRQEIAYLINQLPKSFWDE